MCWMELPRPVKLAAPIRCPAGPDLKRHWHVLRPPERRVDEPASRRCPGRLGCRTPYARIDARGYQVRECAVRRRDKRLSSPHLIAVQVERSSQPRGSHLDGLKRTGWQQCPWQQAQPTDSGRGYVVRTNSAHGRHRPAVASAVEGRSRVGQSSKHIHRCATLACTASSTGPCENHQEWERPAVNWAKFANNLSGMACRSGSSINRICISSTRQAHPMHAMPTTQEHRRRRSGKLGDKGSRPSGMR